MKKILTLIFGLLSAHLIAQNNWALVPDTSTQFKNYYGIYARSNGRLTLSSERGRLFQSNNGGNTITPYQIPGNFSIYTPILFTDDLHGFVGGGCWFTTPECIAGVMLTTTNGGANWQLEQISEDLGLLGFISATNTGTVFTLGDFGALFQFNTTTSQWDSIYQFTDGVNTGLQFLTDEVGYVMRSTHINGQQKFILLKSTDGGTTWFELDSARGIANFNFINENKGFAAITLDTLFRTLDGGETFQPGFVFGDNAVISKIKFFDDEVGYAFVGFPNQHHVVYRTENGGETWGLDFEIDSAYLQDISMVSREEAYLLCSFNTIYHRKGISAVGEPEGFLKVKIWPNPAQDVLNIESEMAGTFTLFATDGRTVLSQYISGNAQINCTDLSPGLYFYALNGRILGRLSLIP